MDGSKALKVDDKLKSTVPKLQNKPVKEEKTWTVQSRDRREPMSGTCPFPTFPMIFKNYVPRERSREGPRLLSFRSRRSLVQRYTFISFE